jgi:hypothetical protein
VTDTPIIDAALLQLVALAPRHINDPQEWRGALLAALRAANPREMPRERLVAMVKTFIGEHRWRTFNAGEEDREIAAMRWAVAADPLMRELYPEEFL